MDMNDFAGSVKELRKRMGITQKELATAAKVSKRTVEKCITAGQKSSSF
ncbi:helix-turn-helix domain-containing protein [Candidatus Roizmanbacteria bacterium]|nr:helix-turn-helix domain-containing protein [Candidatus Roizmanbacteria bacterium]